MRLRLLEAAPRAQDHRLVRIDNPQPIPRAVADTLLDHRSEVMQIDDDIVEPVPLQEQEIPDDQRGARNGEERLRNCVRERPQASAQARREDHGFHCEP